MRSSATFMEQVSALSVEQWRAIYDSSPLGLRTAPKRLANLEGLGADAVLRRTLGNPQTAENLGRGRGNFFSGCYERLVAAAGAAAAAQQLSGSDFVSGYGPFFQVIAPETAGIQTAIGDLGDVAVRSAVLAHYRQARKAHAGQQVVSRQQLSDKPDRIATAIVLESVNASEKSRVELAEALVQLCCFKGNTPRQVRDCQLKTLRWLGYSTENIATLHERPVAVGGHGVRAVAGAEKFQQWFVLVWVLAGLFGVGSCGVYTVVDLGRCSFSPIGGGGGGSTWVDWVPGLVACGPGLLGIAGVIGGLLGALVGLLVNGFVEKRTEVGTRARLAGRAMAITVSVAAAALLFVPAFVGQR